MGDIVLAGTDVKENQAKAWVVNECGNHDELAAGVYLWWLAGYGNVSSGEGIGGVAVEAAKVEELREGVSKCGEEGEAKGEQPRA